MKPPKLPMHVAYSCSDPALQRLLPPFVLVEIQSILEEWQHARDEEQEETPDEHLLYAELSASIDRIFQNAHAHLLLWIGHHERPLNHLYLAGSSCWITADNRYLSFEAIRTDLLPAHTGEDDSSWWIIREPDVDEPPHTLRVYRVHIVPAEQIPDGVPDLEVYADNPFLVTRPD